MTGAGAGIGDISNSAHLHPRLLQQVIPGTEQYQPLDASTPNLVERPTFNLPTMSYNFRRFNARIGAVFVFQTQVAKILAWERPTHTLSLLSVYTLICLDPSLLPIIPIFVLILALLVPSFIARHPAAPSSLPSSTVPYSPFGPPIAPAPTVKPAKELSKDFFRNMRDLQNCMEDFTQVHDSVLALLLPPTNFSDEALSSIVFVTACFSAALLFLVAHWIPWQAIFLLSGWAVIITGHPTVQRQVLEASNASSLAAGSPLAQFRSLFQKWVQHDIVLDTPPETREVEIFELQYRSIAPSGSGEWEAWLFSATPYDPLSSARLASESNGGGRPVGTRFFEDVKPPEGWEWSGKKWVLDLWSREWVEERIITNVEVETEGERWVYDINSGVRRDHNRDSDERRGGGDSPTKGSSDIEKDKETMRPKTPVVSWEEGADSEGRRGHWRRRRWTRMVKRRSQNKEADPKS